MTVNVSQNQFDAAKAARETDCFDPKNVADRFKGQSVSEIRETLAEESSELIIIASNKIKDFNWGSVVRSANAFGVKEVIFTGRRSYDRRGAVGAHNYMNINYWEEDFCCLVSLLKSQGYTVIAAEYIEGDERMVPLDGYSWKSKTAVVFGEEGRSLENDVLDHVDDIVYVPMRGSVRSLNLASCATVFMYDYNYFGAWGIK